MFPAAVLASVEKEVNQPLHRYFDLIVGTSTGGIVALGLGMGIAASDILSMYKRWGPTIFREPSILRRLGIWRQKYDQAPLKKALVEVFGARRLGESQTRLVIPSLNLDNGEVHIFKTAHNERFSTDMKEQCVNVALATSAAPTFFAPYVSEDGIPLVDGGVYATNPTAIGVVEAIGVLGWSRTEILVLSLGCTTEVFDAGKARGRNPGLLHWIPALVGLTTTAQSSISHGMAVHLLSYGQITRVSPYVPAGRYRLDRLDSYDSLAGLAASEARRMMPLLKERFFDTKAPLFFPEHQL